MGAGRHDIESREDVERLVRTFYPRVFADPTIGWLFRDVAKLDLEAHLPHVTAFWETILLGAQTYSGGAFAPHASLHRQVPLRAGHFRAWLGLWGATVDELFAGPRADLARAHAERVANAFHARLETLGAEPAAGGFAVTLHGSPAGEG